MSGEIPGKTPGALPGETPTIPLAEAEALAAELSRRLVFPRGSGRPTLVPVGSVRRRKPATKDVDLLVVVSDRTDVKAVRVLEDATLRPPAAGDRAVLLSTRAAGARRRELTVLWRDAAQRSAAARGAARGTPVRVDLFLARRSELPYALYHHTGSAAYNTRIRAHAKRQGLKLNQYGLYDAASGRPARGAAAIRTERALAARLGVTYRPPTDRAA